jgi:hypothetical protein
VRVEVGDRSAPELKAELFKPAESAAQFLVP